MSSDKELPPLNELFPLDDRPGPARFSPAQREAVIRGAIQAWQSESVPAGPRRRFGRIIPIAALTFALTGAAAALWYGVGATGRGRPARSAVAAPPARSATGAGAETVGRPGAAPLAAEGPANGIAPESRAARDLLQLANRLRRERRWKEAERTYQRVYLQYPGSMSAYVARVAAASIRLEHLQDARGALQLYEEAVATRAGAALEVEARQGIARCRRRLGDREGERQALEELLEKDASGPAAEQARRRLEVMTGER
jgi:tetratricopeptide (TPR) repeat protein